MQSAEFTETWGKVRERLRSEYGDATYNSWLKNIDLEKVSNGHVTMSLPTKFLRDWVINNYANRIRQVWCNEHDDIQSIDIHVKEAALTAVADQQNTFNPAAEIPNGKAASAGAAPAASGQQSLKAQLDPRFTFENFVVGKSNELAHAAARRVAEASDNIPFNPLYIYGGVGLGKTHLMHAIGHALAENSPEKKVLYLSAEKFMFRFISALRYKDTMNFKEQFRSVDVLLIDEPESSFDNTFLYESVNSIIKDLSKRMPVVLVTHNSTVGSSIVPNQILYAMKSFVDDKLVYDVYFGRPTDKFLYTKCGKEIENYTVQINSLEAGVKPYEKRNLDYENIKSWN